MAQNPPGQAPIPEGKVPGAVARLAELTPAQLATLAALVKARIPAPLDPVTDLQARLQSFDPVELQHLLVEINYQLQTRQT